MPAIRSQENTTTLRDSSFAFESVAPPVPAASPAFRSAAVAPAQQQ
jgi:hypothetical protein